MKTIRDIMSADPISCRPETPLRDVVELLIENNISGVPVVEADGTIVGVLGDRDLMKVFYEPSAHTVKSVMTPNPVTIAIDAPLVDVFDYLMSFDFRRVLIHENHKLVGLVSRADLMPPILMALRDKTN
jgi:CBS domain-containing protein